MANPIDNPQFISLLIPTRARPAFLQNLFDSLESTTSDMSLMDAWLYVDDDDTVTREYIESQQYKTHHFAINWVIGERTQTGGQMVNSLWQQSTDTNAGIYLPTTDDLLFVTKGWDQRVREAFNRYPDRIVLAYPDEATAIGDQVTIAILSAQWINTTGRIFTTYFPYWFDDTWVDQVAQMIQRKVKVEIQFNPQGGRGKTTRMRNLPFWGSFFHNMLDERIEEAEYLRGTIYPQKGPEYLENLNAGNRLARRFREDGRKPDDAGAIYAERMLSGPSARTKPSSTYLAIETDAVQLLHGKARSLFVQQEYAESLRMLDNIRRASQKFKNIENERALCLEALGRNDEANKARLTESPTSSDATTGLAWPENSPLVVTGENTDAINPTLSWSTELHIALMPITLRLGTLRDTVTSHPLNQWPSAFGNLWTRYWRRHKG